MLFNFMELTEEERDVIVLALNERPYKEVARLLSKLAVQVNQQMAVALKPPDEVGE